MFTELLAFINVLTGMTELFSGISSLWGSAETFVSELIATLMSLLGWN